MIRRIAAEHWPMLFLLLICALNMMPVVATRVFGDSFFHLVRIDCYASQLWQGDILPRWCFAGDAGLGSPIFLFYPPLPYLAASLFYPLTWLGAPLYTVYDCSFGLATLLAAFGCWRWLRPVSGREAALLGTMLYLFLPYHDEVMVGRSAYGELWVMAFAPWMALAVRGILQGRRQSAVAFGIWTALAMMSEGGVAVCVLIGLGIHVLAAGPRRWRIWALFAASVAGAGLLLLPYVIPAMHYMRFIFMEQMLREDVPWVDRFVMPLKDFQEGRFTFMFGLGLTAIAFTCLAQSVYRKRQRITEPAYRHEAQVWIVTGIVAFFMLFSVSRPLWWLIDLIVPIGFPWRMHLVLMMATSALASLYAHWIVSFGMRRTRWGDMVGLLLFFACYEVFITRAVGPTEEKSYDGLVAAHAVCCPEFHTQWGAHFYDDMKEATDRFTQPGAPPQVKVLQGRARVRLRQWSWKGIVLDLDVPPQKQDVQVRVYIRYFPVWQASTTGYGSVILMPEPETGYMLLRVNPGTHIVTIAIESHLDTLLGTGAKRELKKP